MAIRVYILTSLEIAASERAAATGFQIDSAQIGVTRFGASHA
jgi:hypothetical protein